jgi:uncharacterized protein YycO
VPRWQKEIIFGYLEMRIALYQGKSLISRAIRWQTRSPYSHAAFLLDDGSVIEAWQPVVRWVFPQGKKSALSAQHTPGTKVDLFEFICPLTREEKTKLEYLARRDVGTPYDYRSIVRFLTRDKGDASKRKLFCSEQVFSRCQQIGRPLLDRTEAWRVPPDWIPRSPLLRLSDSIITT